MRWRRLALLLLAALSGAPSSASAHPMPNTVVLMGSDRGHITVNVAVPFPELALAMQKPWSAMADRLNDEQRTAIRDYFGEHVSLRSGRGESLPWTLDSMTLWSARDGNVGEYRELRLFLRTTALAGLTASRVQLVYDAVIHQIPNHFALVQRAHGDSLDDVGVIRYDFARDRTPPLDVDLSAGASYASFATLLSIGFHHVMDGFDHLLFLLTLLVVAPLRVDYRRWSLFEGWRYTTRRVVATSLAFTVGHSLALAGGIYGVVVLPVRIVEALIAASILVTAVHAIRPLFGSREWLVAGAFGTVHGLAFAQGLSSLGASASSRAVTIVGFNLGIEAAQLTVVLLAIPLLALSRYGVYHRVRLLTMSATAAMAIVWVVQRV